MNTQKWQIEHDPCKTIGNDHIFIIVTKEKKTQVRVLIALVPASFVSWSGSGIVHVEYMRALSQANYKTDTSCLQTVSAAQKALALFRFRNRCVR